jgi:hypothetical protein
MCPSHNVTSSLPFIHGGSCKTIMAKPTPTSPGELLTNPSDVVYMMHMGSHELIISIYI